MVRLLNAKVIAVGSTIVLSSLVWLALGRGSTSSAVASTAAPVALAAADGAQIWTRDCAFCHGDRGQGSFQGPAITTSGTASVDFMVRTGRMPAPYRTGAGS